MTKTSPALSGSAEGFRRNRWLRGYDPEAVDQFFAELARGAEHVYVRHSRHGDGPVLAFLPREWEAFVAGVLNGEFGLPAVETE